MISMNRNKKYNKDLQLFMDSMKNIMNRIDKDVEVHVLKNKPAYSRLDVDYSYLNNVEWYKNPDLVVKIENIRKIDEQKIDKLIKKIDHYNYSVEIIDDLDYKEVTSDTKYTIRISNIDNMCVSIDLVEYANSIRNYDFDEVEFIIKKLNKIEGACKNIRVLAETIAEYITYIMYDKNNYVLTYDNIGWDTYNGELVFKYDELISCDDKYIGRIKNPIDNNFGIINVDKVELVDNWINVAKKITSNPCAALLIGAGLSGVIRALLPYTKENNININIYGKAGSGKSTIEHFILGMFGSPMLLEGSFIDTDNSIDERRTSRPILPYILDDRMLKLQGSTDKVQARTIMLDIFREYEGRLKDKSGQTSNLGIRAYGPVISSSVESMFNIMYQSNIKDLGQYRRFIELNIDDVNLRLFNNSEDAEEAERAAVEYSGIGIYLYVNYIMNKINSEVNDKGWIIDKYVDIKNNIDTRLRNVEQDNNLRGLVASSQRFALIIVSYEILYEMLYNDKASEENNQSEAIEDILINNLIDKYSRISNINKLKGSKQDIIKYITSSPKFKQVSGSVLKKDKIEMLESKGLIYGVYTLSDKDPKLYMDGRYRLSQFLYMNNIPVSSVIDKYVKEINSRGLSSDKALDFGVNNYNTYRVKVGVDYNSTFTVDKNNNRLTLDSISL